jgi:hypothetical protein
VTTHPLLLFWGGKGTRKRVTEVINLVVRVITRNAQRYFETKKERRSFQTILSK